MSKVVVFGSLNMDLSVECDHAPKVGETVLGHGFVANPGGKGANQAVACALMGVQTHMVGSVGNDSFGTKLIRSLIDAGVLVEHVRTLPDIPTGTATILRSGGDNRIVVDPGANATTGIDEVCAVIEKFEGEGNVFLTQLECDLDTTLDATAYATEFGFYTVLNAAPACELPSDIYQFLDLVCVNEVEALALTGINPIDETSVTRALMSLVARGCHAAIITLGARGSVALVGGDIVRVPAFRVDVVDTTGAGDAYIGVLVAEIADGKDIADAMVDASAAGALATTHVGAQQAMPTRSELRAFLAARDYSPVR